MDDERKKKTEMVSGLILQCLEDNKIDDMSAIAGLGATMLVIFANRKTDYETVETTLEMIKNSYKQVVEIMEALKNLTQKK